MVQKLLYLQTAILGGGVLFSWSNVVADVREFVALYGTLLRFTDCIIPNPLTTACFYGATALLVAFVWSLVLVQKFSVRGERNLRFLLIFGTVFAFSVLGYEFLEYYHIFSFETVKVSCSPGVFPLRTPCFYGALFFVSAAIVSTLVLRSVRDGALQRGEE